ncbi:DUF5677 domain-containing protein [Niallia circulans]|uniref:DUF5677 domain-containing protein n=1 Tax=Niallia circulans TaxID=1397 RepID=UPI001F41BF04|nr:DUF5677 domain-containing protein [Niallia circulans]MCF2647406.1 hypothetical protein [Niallia circulans]
MKKLYFEKMLGLADKILEQGEKRAYLERQVYATRNYQKSITICKSILLVLDHHLTETAPILLRSLVELTLDQGNLSRNKETYFNMLKYQSLLNKKKLIKNQLDNNNGIKKLIEECKEVYKKLIEGPEELLEHLKDKGYLTFQQRLQYFRTENRELEDTFSDELEFLFYVMGHSVHPSTLEISDFNTAEYYCDKIALLLMLNTIYYGMVCEMVEKKKYNKNAKKLFKAYRNVIENDEFKLSFHIYNDFFIPLDNFESIDISKWLDELEEDYDEDDY